MAGTYGINKVNPRLNVFFVDVSVDDDLSEEFFKGYLDICGLILPTMTSTVISFQGSRDNVTYGTVTWNGTALSLTVASGGVVMFDPAYLSGLPWVKVKTGSAEGADRTIYPVFRNFS